MQPRRAARAPAPPRTRSVLLVPGLRMPHETLPTGDRRVFVPWALPWLRCGPAYSLWNSPLMDYGPYLRLAPFAYHPLVAFTTRTTSSITGTSISTPTTVASAAPDSKPKRLIAAATASSKKLLAPISADGH